MDQVTLPVAEQVCFVLAKRATCCKSRTNFSWQLTQPRTTSYRVYFTSFPRVLIGFVGMWKRYYLSIEGIQRKKQTGKKRWTSGRSLHALLWGLTWNIYKMQSKTAPNNNGLKYRWKRAYSTLRNETKRNEMVLCETVLCETVTTQCFITPYLEYLEFHWKLKICKDKPGANFLVKSVS